MAYRIFKLGLIGIAVAAGLAYPTLAKETRASLRLEIVKVTDGDTVVAKTAEGFVVKVRLRNIDAPEKGQAFGKASARKLRELCLGKMAEFTQLGADRYDRNLALVSCDGVMANRKMVADGLAWVYTQYNDDAALPIMQKQARDKCLGLWREGKVTEPVEYRRAKDKSRDPVALKLDSSRCRTLEASL